MNVKNRNQSIHAVFVLKDRLCTKLKYIACSSLSVVGIYLRIDVDIAHFHA